MDKKCHLRILHSVTMVTTFFCFQYNNTLIPLREKGCVGFFFLDLPVVTLMDFYDRTEKLSEPRLGGADKNWQYCHRKKSLQILLFVFACIVHETSLKSLIVMYPSDSTGH